MREMETLGVSRIGNGITRGPRKNYRKRRTNRIVIVPFVIASLIFAVLIGQIPTQSPLPQERALIAFSPEVLESFYDAGQYSSLALESGTNYPVIACYYPPGYSITRWDGSFWNHQYFSEVPGDFGQYISLALNSSNYYFLSLYDLLPGDLLGNAGIIDSVGNVGQYTSIAVNRATDKVAISYYDVTNGNLKVAVNTSELEWTNHSVDQPNNVGQYTNIVFMDANNSLSILYYDVTNGDLKNAWQWGGTGPWYNVTIESTGDVGKWPSQAVAPSGDWYGSFYDATNGNLRYIDWVDGGAGGMGSAIPDSSGNVGQYTSIGVNSTGHVFISYYDATNGDLKLAWNESTSWYNMTLDSTNDVGRFTSLKIGSDDIIQISYYDATNGDLKYVKVLPAEIPIPEFGEVAIPVIGIIAAIALFSRRNKA